MQPGNHRRLISLEPLLLLPIDHSVHPILHRDELARHPYLPEQLHRKRRLRVIDRLIFGYVDEETELNIYKDYLGINTNLNNIQQVLGIEEILHLQQQCENVFLHEEIIKAVRNIVWETRKQQDIVLGASTRSGITFLKCLKAYALVNGRTYVIEDDVHDLASPVLDHRLIYRNKEAKAKLLTGIVNAEMERLSKLKIN